MDEETQAKMRKLHQIVQELFPGAVVLMKWDEDTIDTLTWRNRQFEHLSAQIDSRLHELEQLREVYNEVDSDAESKMLARIHELATFNEQLRNIINQGQ